MKKYISVQKQLLEYELKINKHQTNIVLSVRGGLIRISAPPHAADWQIEQLIYQNLNQVLRSIDNFQNQKKVKTDHDRWTIKIFDEPYYVEIVDENIHTRLTDRVIYLKRGENEKQMVDKLYNFLKTKFRTEFQELMQRRSAQMGCYAEHFSLKNMTTKWGVCYPRESKINLNIKLIHFPKWVIDYVVVHELTHLVHHNHSKDFWHMVEFYHPKFREAKAILKNPGI